jgi:hypothetical protein
MEIIQPVEIKEGAFDFVFPYKYFPSKVGKTEFEFVVSIESQSKLSQINHPKNFEILEKSDQKVTMTNTKNLESDVHIFYKSACMEEPKFFFQKKDGEIALMAQFMPTFES